MMKLKFAEKAATDWIIITPYQKLRPHPHPHPHPRPHPHQGYKPRHASEMKRHMQLLLMLHKTIREASPRCVTL